MPDLGGASLNHINEDDANYTYGMLQQPHGSADLRGGREGRVVHLWVSQATILDCASVKLDNPPAALVAPNGYMGARARIIRS